MAVLSDNDIRKIINKKGIVITPYNDNRITGVGYDLGIGCIVDIDEISDDLPECQNGKYLLIPKHRYIIITKEYVWLSRSYMGTLHARGSLTLKGIYTTSTTVDPNFSGHMVMCITNMSQSQISINENDPFITLVIHKLQTATTRPLGITENGDLRIAQRAISSIFPSETDVRRAKINNYLIEQDQHERTAVADLTISANVGDYVLDLVTAKWHLFFSSKGSIISGVATFFLVAIIVLCGVSLYNPSFIAQIIPNFASTSVPFVSAIIAAVAALIALHKKK